MPLRADCRAATLRVMARPLRHIEANGIYHVTSRGNRRQDINIDFRDCLRFEKLLATTVDRFELVLIAWCLMTNHLHLAVQVPHANLSAAMQWLKGTYAQKYNWRHGYEDHLFGGRFRSRQTRGETDFLNVCEYVLANPAEAGIVELSEAYPWSSCASTLGLRPPRAYVKDEMLLATLDPDPERAREILQRRLRLRVERQRLALSAAASGVIVTPR